MFSLCLYLGVVIVKRRLIYGVSLFLIVVTERNKEMAPI
jgi:hypothetical protein